VAAAIALTTQSLDSYCAMVESDQPMILSDSEMYSSLFITFISFISLIYEQEGEGTTLPPILF